MQKPRIDFSSFDVPSFVGQGRNRSEIHAQGKKSFSREIKGGPNIETI